MHLLFGFDTSNSSFIAVTTSCSRGTANRLLETCAIKALLGPDAEMPISEPVRQSFTTSVGRVEVLVDAQSRVVSAYRFDAGGRPVAAALESWDYTDLADLLARQTGVPAVEANDIALAVNEEWSVHGDEELDYYAEDRRPNAVRTWAWALASLAALIPLAIVLWAALHAIP